MNTSTIANTLHSLHIRKLSKPLAACITALFVVSMLSAFSLTAAPAQAETPTLALHTSGSQILDTNGNAVYLRGMGLAGFAPDMILWGQGQSDNWGNQWNYNPTTVMDQTFSAMKDQWHINMIRVFIYPSWYYRDNIVPAQESSSYASSTTPISIKTYLRTLCQEADKYGIYVDIVPYMLTPSTSSFDKDPYATSGFGWQGMPMQGWDEPATRFLKDAGYGSNELGFWSWFWADMANNLKSYPNAIFEAWNEPNLGSDVDAIPSGYMSYLTAMYNAIRGTGATNIIMMQWHMGWFPNGYGNNLSFAKQINDAIHPTNLVYTTHFYYYAPSDLSSYWAKDYNTLKSQLQTGINSMGVTAPLVSNEEGSCLASSPNKQNDYTWWQNLLAAQRDLNIGATPYYWLSDSGLGGVYMGESMLSSGYSPNTMGQSFINAYQAPTSTPTPSPTTTPTPTASPTPTPTAAPTSTPTATPTPTPTPNPTATPTPNPTQTPTPTPTSTVAPSIQPSASATPTPTLPTAPTSKPTATPSGNPTPSSTQTATPEPSASTATTQLLTFGYYTRQSWYGFHWPVFNGWVFRIR
jgi:hypothetical protein